jgi:hypothetical protein
LADVSEERGTAIMLVEVEEAQEGTVSDVGKEGLM